MLRRRKKLKIAVEIICVLLLAMALTLLLNSWANSKVTLTEYTYRDEELPPSFKGFKIFAISDLHNAPFSKELISMIKKEAPDIIVFLGDMVQLPDHNVSEAKRIAEEFKGKTPVYAISGNHDRQNKHYWDIYDTLYYAGVIWLEDNYQVISRDYDSIMLLGLESPEKNKVTGEKISEMNEFVENKVSEERLYSILLNHRADLYPELKDAGANLILSGHLHGGGIRLPFLGGIIKPPGEFGLSSYEYGYVKEENSSAMIVSGGCDKNPRKRRLFNPPEALSIILESE